MINGMKILCLDIETAPALAYIWDLKTRYVPLAQIASDGHVLCWAAGWLNQDHGIPEILFRSKWKDGERRMVRDAHKLITEADAVITYNGSSFDLPRLNTEFLKYRLGPPSPYHSIDLYQVVRRKFRVLSKSLKHMLSILNLENKLEHKGMELWTGCMSGNKEDQATMADYNVRDVKTLASLYSELLPWIDNHPNVALWMNPSEVPVCTNCGSHKLRFKGYKRTRVMSYEQYLCRDCGKYSRSRTGKETGKDRREDVLV